VARMFPRTLLDADVKSDAERKVFEALRDQMPDEWEVFHSASVMYRDHAQGAQDDEGDFVLVHPERGIVALEVKGGGIECRHGEWFRLDRAGRTERMRDPFTQALDHRYSLGRKFEESNGRRDLFIVHALAFPDISVHELVLAPDAPPDLIIDRNGVKDITAGINGVLAYHHGSRDKRAGPGPEAAELLRDLLAPQIRIEVPMATTLEEEERQLILLTREQSALLRRFGRAKRMVVTGCAGSGKTMLAVERGKELAAEGRQVLFVCFNKALAKHLREHERVKGMDVFHFHSLCTYLARRNEVPLPTYDGLPPQEYWDTILPDALVDAIGIAGPLYDDILVDEAQDLHSDWLTALTCTLRDEDDGSIWLFMDDNQRVYDKTLDVPREYHPFDLTVNCRNTQAIHREVMKLYQGIVKPEVKGPPGRDMELILSEDQPSSVAGVVHRLRERDDIRGRDIVVLSAHGRDSSDVFATGRYSPDRARGVYFSSIRGFKGLESPVVVLCELEGLDDETRKQQLYVGISRARNHCVIVAPRQAA
jgi:hypothetical protein